MLVKYTGKFGRGVFGQRMEHDDTKEVTDAEWKILEALGQFELVDDAVAVQKFHAAAKHNSKTLEASTKRVAKKTAKKSK